MATVGPQAFGDHPAVQRLARHRAAVQLKQLLLCQRMTENAHGSDQPHRQIAELSREPAAARPAAMLRHQVGGTVQFEATQEAENLLDEDLAAYRHRRREDDPTEPATKPRPSEFLGVMDTTGMAHLPGP